jgi:hypothetical protein
LPTNAQELVDVVATPTSTQVAAVPVLLPAKSGELVDVTSHPSIPVAATHGPSALTQENVEALQLEMPLHHLTAPSVSSPSGGSTDRVPSVPISSYQAVESHELPEKDRELSEADINLIILMAQSEEFNEADYCKVLIRRFERTPHEAYLLARIAVAKRSV